VHNINGLKTFTQRPFESAEIAEITNFDHHLQGYSTCPTDVSMAVAAIAKANVARIVGLAILPR
jgi:hypothetical protein